MKTTGSSDPWDNPILIQSKTHPCYSHCDYLHLADLNEFMKDRASSEPLTILDYGAGASPYRCYFPNADYRRADITGAPSLYYKIEPNSTVPELDNTFDLIISTQVAEHVVSPELYFKECLRLLKPGGRLILTTHGIWDEHGSPYDFQRWTDAGLLRDLQHSGFQKIALYKLTCGLRATLVILTRSLFEAIPPASVMRRFLFKAFRWAYSRVFPSIYKLSDSWWAQDRIVEVGEGKTPVWYIVIAAVAYK